MSPKQERYYRHLASAVLRWYSEFEGGVVPGEQRFDPNILNYRVDVELTLKRFTPQECSVVLLIHRDGLTHAQALSRVGWTHQRPDKLVADIETRMGQQFERKGLVDLQRYLTR